MSIKQTKNRHKSIRNSSFSPKQMQTSKSKKSSPKNTQSSSLRQNSNFKKSSTGSFRSSTQTQPSDRHSGLQTSHKSQKGKRRGGIGNSFKLRKVTDKPLRSNRVIRKKTNQLKAPGLGTGGRLVGLETKENYFRKSLRKAQRKRLKFTERIFRDVPGPERIKYSKFETGMQMLRHPKSTKKFAHWKKQRDWASFNREKVRNQIKQLQN